jgi:hypothetical protein
MIRLLIRCYPRSWRARYGAEFAAVLAERSLSPFDVADVLLGALDAHLRLRGLATGSVGGRGFGMSQRVAGYAAIWAGILWLFALFGYSSMFIVAAAIAFVVALVGLSAGPGRSDPSRTWAPVAVGTAGAVSAAIGAVTLAMNGWNSSWETGYPFVLLLVGVGGVYSASAIFAVRALRERTFSRRSSQLLLVGSCGGLASMGLYLLAFASAFPPSALPPLIPAAVLGWVGPASLIVFAVGLIGVGLDALLRDLASSRQVHSGKPVA